MAGRVRQPEGPGRRSEGSGLLTVIIDGQPFAAYPGDTVAAVLFSNGRRAWRLSRSGQARGVLCGMGICFDCLVSVDGAPGLRACQTLVREGMRIDTSYSEGEKP